MSRAMTAIAASPPTFAPRWASETATSSGAPSARHQTVVCSPDASPAAAPASRRSSRRAGRTAPSAGRIRRPPPRCVRTRGARPRPTGGRDPAYRLRTRRFPAQAPRVDPRPVAEYRRSSRPNVGGTIRPKRSRPPDRAVIRAAAGQARWRSCAGAGVPAPASPGRIAASNGPRSATSSAVARSTIAARRRLSRSTSGPIRPRSR